MSIQRWHIVRKNHDLIHVKKGRKIRYWLRHTWQGWQVPIGCELVVKSSYDELLYQIEKHESIEIRREE